MVLGNVMVAITVLGLPISLFGSIPAVGFNMIDLFVLLLSALLLFYVHLKIINYKMECYNNACYVYSLLYICYIRLGG